MNFEEGTILEVDFKKGFTVRTENGAIYTINRIAIPFANDFHFGGLAKVPEPGDGVLVASKRDGGKFVIPMYVSKINIDEELSFSVKEFDILTKEFKLKQGDFFVLTPDLEGAIILRAAGILEFVSSQFYIKHNPDPKYGGLKILTGNIRIAGIKGGFKFDYIQDDVLGTSVTQSIFDPPTSTGVAAPIYKFVIERGMQKFVNIEVERVTGNIKISSDIWKIEIDYTGQVNVQATVVNVKAGKINLGLTQPQMGIVTGFPGGTMPTCYVTGAPIKGSTSCFASS